MDLRNQLENVLSPLRLRYLESKLKDFLDFHKVKTESDFFTKIDTLTYASKEAFAKLSISEGTGWKVLSLLLEPEATGVSDGANRPHQTPKAGVTPRSNVKK